MDRSLEAYGLLLVVALALLMLPSLLGGTPESGTVPRVSHHATFRNDAAVDVLVNVRLDGELVCVLEVAPSQSGFCEPDLRPGNRTWTLGVDHGQGPVTWSYRTPAVDPVFALGRFSATVE